jgi:hypothetical protein
MIFKHGVFRIRRSTGKDSAGILSRFPGRDSGFFQLQICDEEGPVLRPPDRRNHVLAGHMEAPVLIDFLF